MTLTPEPSGGDKAPSVPLREAARRVAKRLREAGFEAYFAGGCVRDGLLGLEPDDYDIATSARPEEVLRVFPKARGVGEAFGVMLVRGDRHIFEVATFRTDVEYVDGRRPSSVRFATSREDAERRDFTINGLFEDPETGAIVDFVDGQADLERRVLRAIGDPALRFAEDHLRLLRAVRFAARYHLAIDARTAQSMRECGPKLALIARERIGLELRRMLEHPTRAVAAGLLEEYRLDGVVLGEGPMHASAGRLGQLPPEARFELALLAWGLDRQGSGVAADLAPGQLARWRNALVLSNGEEALIADMARCRRGLPGFFGERESRRKRLAARPGFADACRLHAIDDPRAAAGVEEWRSRTDPATIAPLPLVTGDDLIGLGLAPGPRFRDLLERTYDAQLEGAVRTPEEAIELVRRLGSEGAGGASG